jgi:hypothetical protein
MLLALAALSRDVTLLPLRSPTGKAQYGGMTSTLDSGPYVLVAVDDRGAGFTGRRLGLRLRVVARLRAGTLDRCLAGGTPPEATLQLAARARVIVSQSARHKLARDWAHLLALAEQPPGPIRGALVIRRAPVLAAAADIRELIAALRQSLPVPARAVAMASVLLTDARGPIYDGRGEPSLTARLAPILDRLQPWATLDHGDGLERW